MARSLFEEDAPLVAEREVKSEDVLGLIVERISLSRRRWVDEVEKNGVEKRVYAILNNHFTKMVEVILGVDTSWGSRVEVKESGYFRSLVDGKVKEAAAKWFQNNWNEKVVTQHLDKLKVVKVLEAESVNRLEYVLKDYAKASMEAKAKELIDKMTADMTEAVYADMSALFAEMELRGHKIDRRYLDKLKENPAGEE
jgi:hypothetical protein